MTEAATTSRRGLLAAASSAALASCTGALAACSGGTASQGGSSGTGAGSGLTIGMSYTPDVQFAPFYMALAERRYAAGVSLRHHGANEGLFDALAAGTEDLVVAGADEAVVAASNGSDLVVVGGFYQTHPACVIVPEDSPVSVLADLRGRRVGLPGRFGETWYALQVAMDSASLTEEDLTLEEVGYTQQAALVGGKVDAVVGFSNNDAVQIARSGTPVRTISVGEDVPLVGASLVTSGAVLSTRRDELAEAVRASAAGMELFVNDPDGAVEVTRDYVPDLVDPAQAAQAREVAVATGGLVRPATSSVVGALSRGQVSEMISFLGSHDLLGGSGATVSVTVTEVCDPLLES